MTAFDPEEPSSERTNDGLTESLEAIPVADDGATVRALREQLELARGSIRLPPMLGRFKIGPCLGRGGEGRVFRAHDTKLDRTVALKVLSSGSSESSLLREARAAVRGRHPVFVEVYGVETIDGHTVLIMELVRGMSLKGRIAARSIDPNQALEWVIELAEALEVLHSVGVLHRDITPSNVLVDEAGRVRLIDFGIAELTDAAETHSSGTPAYMAPEQASAAACPRSDIFSLGLVLFEATTGRRPRRAHDGEVIIGSKERDALELAVGARRGRRLEQVVRKATEFDELRRFPNARSLAVELIRLRPTSRRTWARRLALGGAMLALGIVTSFSILQSKRGTNPPVSMARLTHGNLGPLVTDAVLTRDGASVVWRESSGAVRVADIATIDVSRPPVPLREMKGERLGLANGHIVFQDAAGVRAIDFSGRDAALDEQEARLPRQGPFAIGTRGVAWGESSAIHLGVGGRASVVELAQRDRIIGAMGFSPSGEDLAFLECEPGTLVCTLRNLRSGGHVETSAPADDLGEGVAWSDAGIYFTRHERSIDGRRGSLMLVEKGQGPARVIASWDDATVRVGAASTDGRRVLVLRSRATWETSLIDLTHREQGPIRLDLDATARVSEIAPEHIYLTRSLPTSDEGVVVQRGPTLSRAVAISPSKKGTMLVHPVSSSTGSLLAIRLVEETDGTLSAWLVERTGDVERRLSDLGRGRQAAWTPPPLWARVRCGTERGAPCVFGTYTGTALQFTIYDVITGSTKPGRRIDDATHDTQLGWSLDAKGERVAWPAAKSGSISIGSVANSQAPTVLSLHPMQRAFRTAWLPDEKAILVAAAGEDTMDRPLVTVPIDGTPTAVLARFAYGIPSSLAVDPQSQTVAVTVTYLRRDLWLVCTTASCPN